MDKFSFYSCRTEDPAFLLVASQATLVALRDHQLQTDTSMGSRHLPTYLYKG